MRGTGKKTIFPVFMVCRAWQLTWWCKSTMGVGSNQPLAQGKGVHREGNLKEAGGKVPNRGTRTTSGISGWMSLPNKTKSYYYPETGV
ncbi:hypothetical protein FACS189437_08860 [Bacteroidia bacterium]|nr:hypothetical protein FACS189437_08860 [Bacteroidia bacterium]